MSRLSRKANVRRGYLVDKDIAGSLTSRERAELDELQARVDYHLQQVAPRPTDVLDKLEALLTLKDTEDTER